MELSLAKLNHLEKQALTRWFERERQTLSWHALRVFDPLYDEEYALTKQQFYNLISAVMSGLSLEDIPGEYIKRIWFT